MVGRLSWRVGSPPVGPGVVRRPSRRAGSGQEALLEGREWSGGPPKRPRVFRKPSRNARMRWKTLPEGREWLGGPPVGP